MMSRSYTNLLDLAEGNFSVMSQPRDKKRLTRVMTVPGVISELDDDQANTVSSDVPSSVNQDRIIIPPVIFTKFYHGFCKQNLWPLFHYMLPLSVNHGGTFDRFLWEAYVAANKIFSQRVIEVINPEDDYVWIHDYHLMVLPTFLRRRFNRLRMGFFLHSPFPSSEIYRTLPVREEILKALLNSDLIGFHTFDYARHFLSCCSRMFGLEYQSKRGYIGLEYYGRTIGIKIMPVGVHMEQIESALRLADEESRIGELKRQFEGKTVLLGVDDMDVFKGVNLKILATEQLLKRHPKWQGKAVLVQITNPAWGRGKDLESTHAEIKASCMRINQAFGQTGYEPLIFIDKPVSLSERVAYYTIAECVVVTAVRDGMNLTPYEYVACRQGVSESSGPKKSMLVVSEFIGCSPSLSGAIRVNPWNIEATAEAMNEAISMVDAEKQLRHEKHYRYVSAHDVAFWSRSFFQDMERTCKDHFRRRCWGIGLSFGFRVVALDPNFRQLSIDHMESVYLRSKNRAILFDYDGTVMPQASHNKAPSAEVISIINTLSGDTKNIVFVVSGRGRESLDKWFSPCNKLGIAAEHGYFMRWSSDDKWEVCGQSSEFGWKEIAEPVMKLYTEATDGSSIETKESSLGLTKGLVAEKIFTTMDESGRQADFVLCIGDDRSDEEMFEIISSSISGGILSSNTSVFACTVGQKPSKAKYYLDDPAEVVNMLQALAEASDPGSLTDTESDISL
ncbi:Alpha,alpha-trehalose-phosphate synthase 5 [Hibiscus syriacus]|uniref:Alpha,alpha-trehalose-phosphate synthase 5 n=1 Tax=Hibiscus syriacus TaxID=106335 RepID=A0A6A2Z474_HIBSY|nr:Alpha,alpha-trehalose-phosphate synthase 5 [Hibiscus syriacus]